MISDPVGRKLVPLHFAPMFTVTTASLPLFVIDVDVGQNFANRVRTTSCVVP